MNSETLINWTKAGERNPSNIPKYGFESPYVSCLVWVANPDHLKSGVCETVRWDTTNACWDKASFKSWVFDAPMLKITHFCDTVNAPTP